MNKEILSKVDEIVNYIKKTPSYQNYLKATNLLSQDEDLILLINEIKKYQKAIVQAKGEKKELERKIQKCLDLLNDSPLYQQYINYQAEVNNLLTIFENKINKYFLDIFN